MKLAKGLREPGCDIRQSKDGKIGAIYFCFAGKQFVLLFDLVRDEEACMAVMKEGRWQRI